MIWYDSYTMIVIRFYKLSGKDRVYILLKEFEHPQIVASTRAVEPGSYRQQGT